MECYLDTVFCGGRLVSLAPNLVPVVILCFLVLLNFFGRVLGYIGRIKGAVMFIQMVHWSSY